MPSAHGKKRIGILFGWAEFKEKNVEKRHCNPLGNWPHAGPSYPTEGICGRLATWKIMFLLQQPGPCLVPCLGDRTCCSRLDHVEGGGAVADPRLGVPVGQLPQARAQQPREKPLAQHLPA